MSPSNRSRLRAWRYQRPWWTTSSSGRRSGLTMGASGGAAREPRPSREGRRRAAVRIAEADQVRDLVVAGDAEDGPGLVLVTDGGVPAADAEVGRGQHDRVGRLAQVVLVDDPGPVVGRFGQDQGDGGGGPGDVPGPLPDRAQL